MKIGIDMGHTISGPDYGAVGILKESICTREIGGHLKVLLSSLGHEVIDCTVDYASSVNESLQKRVNIANSTDIDLFISIHLNSGGGHGVETYVISRGGQAENFATKVQNKLIELGYIDRGIKTANFYVIKNTIAPAILVECGFVDSPEDCNRYNAYNIAKAIAEAVTGQEIVKKEKRYWVVTDYLPLDQEGYINIDRIKQESFYDVIIHERHDTKGVWIETQYLSHEKCVELKSRIGSLFWSIKEI